jgi:ribosomal-protein-serine acetyltransferase
MPQPILLESGIELQPVQIADAVELYEAIDRNRARLGQWLAWATANYCLEDTARFLADRMVENDARIALTLVIRHKGRLCGSIGLHRFDPRNRSSSIGYWIDAESEGQGMITQACRAIVNAGFSEYGLHRIEIRCASANQRSAAVPLRVGFREEGLLREAEWLYDHFVDLRVFSRLQTDAK